MGHINHGFVIILPPVLKIVLLFLLINERRVQVLLISLLGLFVKAEQVLGSFNFACRLAPSLELLRG